MLEQANRILNICKGRDLIKAITMFVTSWCPHCQRALSAMTQLKSENSNYESIEVNIIDEELKPEIAQMYDYYYVPTYYVDNIKVHEGAASKEIIAGVFDKALEK